jgi:hypothetical protein
MDGEVKDKILFQANKYGSEESLDNQGRVLVPAVLRETAGMSGEVKILWSSNHMLVLSASRFEEVAEQKALAAGAIDPTVTLAFDDIHVQDEIDGELFLESTVIATAIGPACDWRSESPS